jgi:hypothetical protein
MMGGKLLNDGGCSILHCSLHATAVHIRNGRVSGRGTALHYPYVADAALILQQHANVVAFAEVTGRGTAFIFAHDDDMTDDYELRYCYEL